MRELAQRFSFSIAATVAALLAALAYGGAGAVALVAVLIGLEASISFDNAVVNASVLRRMSRAWQRVFLTLGILIAVFGMRLVFPIAIVAVATKLGFVDVLDQALNDKDAYARNAERAAPVIGALGGAFLMMVALTFFLDPERELHWLAPVERAIGRLGAVPGLPAALTAVAVLVVSQLVSPGAERDVLVAGLVGLVAYVLVHGASELLEQRTGAAEATGAAGLGAFLYLEMLDASFSLDGVLGAFALTQDIVLIAIGLGVGAIYIRSLTIHLVRHETLSRYVYLEHGAHWAIAALAVVLFVSTEGHVPEWVTGTIGLGTVAAAFASSIARNRRREAQGEG